MLACRVVCCSHQSDRCIRVCILLQSDCRIRVCISHQSYHNIWISCTNHSVWVLFSCTQRHGIRGLCIKNEINQKFWVHLLSFMIVAFAGASSCEVEILGVWKVRIYFYRIILTKKRVFTAPFLTTHSPNNLHSITYYENNVQSPIRTYPVSSLHEH